MTDTGRELAETAARTLAGLGPTELARTLGVATARTLAVTSPGAAPLDASAAVPVAGDLEVRSTLGEGGMGIVQLATQRSLAREVAVKRVRDATDGNAIAALIAEATVTGGLEHPAIVPIHALVRDAAGPMMVMKRLEGVTLRALIDDPAHARWSELGPDRLGFFVQVVRRLCDALALAASRGVVHRDVKPENVMIGLFGEVYLLDWGIAVAAGRPLPSDAIAGTPVYMAPEMLRPASGEIDARSDVYLLGATLHECITGKPPHDGQTLLAVLASVAESAPIPYGSEVPAALAALLHRAMHADPKQRFADARELGRALDAFVGRRAASALVDAADERARALDEAIDRGASHTEIHAIFPACRFAYEHALRDWPDSEAALRGRRRVIERMASWAIATRDLGFARSLVTALDPIPPALKDGLAVLEREADAADAERARLRSVEHEHDIAVGARERRIAVRIAAVGVLLGVTTLAVLYARGLFVPSARSVAVFTVPPMLGIASALVFWRDRLLVNRVSRQIAFTTLMLVCAVMAHRLVAVARDTPLSDVASGDAFIVAVVAGISALTLRRLFFVPALLFLVAGSAAPFLEARAFIPILGAAVISVLTIVLAPKSLSEPALGSAVSKRDARA
jgi:serine/threonine-protein kinase